MASKVVSKSQANPETKGFLLSVAKMYKGKNVDVHLKRQKKSGSAKLSVRVKPAGPTRTRAF